MKGRNMDKDIRSGAVKFYPMGRKDAFGTVLEGRIGKVAKRGMERLHAPEFNEKFLIADLDFNQERWFTNYSGDISGRFLECMTLAGGGDASYHPALPYMLAHIPENQREEGYFGIYVDFGKAIDYEQEIPRMMPILWGNARMLPALVLAWQTFGDERMLEGARKLGDFYIRSSKELISPERVEEYRATGTYAPGYATCYFPAVEGLVRLWEATGEEKYLEQAGKMADFRKKYGFDHLPIEHSHGYLCSLYGLLLLYCAEGEEKWLQMAEENWNALMDGGYVLPTGGLLEKAVIGFDLDEGCSQADWLRVNLLFYSITGREKYLDMAERVLNNQLRINQCTTGGFGHRRVLYDDYGAAGYGTYLWEALWCCDFHVVTALLELKRYVLLQGGEPDVVMIPLFIDFRAENEYAHVTMKELEGPAYKRQWKIIVSPKTEPVKIRLRIPDWAGEINVFDDCKTAVVLEKEGRWLKLPAAKATVEYTCEAICPVWLENRHFERGLLACDNHTFLLRQGPDLLAQIQPGAAPAVIDRLGENEEAVYVFGAEGGKIKPAGRMEG